MATASAWEAKRERVKAKYRRDRLALICDMGGECEECGETNPDDLQFHHTRSRTWTASALSRWSRIKRYREDWDRGELVLLCADCNKRAGVPGGDDDALF